MILEPLTKLVRTITGGPLREPDARAKVPIRWIIATGVISVDAPIDTVPRGWVWVVSSAALRLTVNNTTVATMTADGRDIWSPGVLTIDGIGAAVTFPPDDVFNFGQVIAMRFTTIAGAPAPSDIPGEGYIQFDAYKV